MSSNQECLIVDDSVVVRKITAKAFEELGFVCHMACNGEEAMQHCLNEMPDLIMLDVHMPIMSGFEFLDKMNELNWEGNKPKVIICTVGNDTEIINEAISKGADEMIMKPFDREILHGKLQYLGLIQDNA